MPVVKSIKDRCRGRSTSGPRDPRTTLARCWRGRLGPALLALVAVGCAAGGGESRDLPRGAFQAATLLERSIDHHDPERIWGRARVDAQLELERPEQPRASFQYSWDPRSRSLRAASITTGQRIEWILQPDPYAGDRIVFDGFLNGSRDVPSKLRSDLSLTRERAELWRDYYGFLLGLPMVLADHDDGGGARLVDDIRSETFGGRTVHVLRVVYREPVGHHTWDVFLDPQTFAMVGARFFEHDPSDGETIVFEGEIQSDGVRIPKLRSWYTTASEEFLGTDRIQTLALEP